jgi:hypothetical protein
MTAIRVDVTAEHIASSGLPASLDGWTQPVELALAELTGQDVSIDGDGDTGNIASIGSTSATTLVVELPAEANAWLNARWDGKGPGEPFAFDLAIDAWLVDLVGSIEWVTLTEASAALRTITPNGLRTAAQNRRDGSASERALAARLGMRRIGRDWLIPRHRLDAEVARRKGRWE